MKISEQWLREWAPTRLSTKKLAERLTMAGLEVGAIEPVSIALDHVVVGEVIGVTPHPNAERLTVCSVRVGKRKALQVVCGAPNVTAGIKAPVALPGATLAGGLKIKKAKLRGVDSSGMLCSESELGFAECSEGLMVLGREAKVGETIGNYLQLDDVSLDIELTPNRGDCLSVAGMAREVAVLADVRYRPNKIKKTAATSRRKWNVSLQAKQDCPRYVGRVIEGIKTNAVTPLWMRERLRRSGLRSIHPVVDVTNYVMLELGQPMHAFDLDKLHGKIVVRRAGKNESLVLLDGNSMHLTVGTLLIADEKKPLALAGVMGGLESAVSDGTVNLFLESAYFKPGTIGGCARSMGLQTDSSYRFERGVAPDVQATASERATELLLQIVGGRPGPLVEQTAKKYLPKRASIRLRHKRIARILGHEIPPKQVEKILKALSFGVKKAAEGWRVRPPPFRFDLAKEIDLIEEIARVFGYEHLSSTLPSIKAGMNVVPENTIRLSQFRDLLVGRDYQEVITYSFVGPSLQAMIDPTVVPAKLSNPISAELSVMRTSLWPGLLQAIIYNQNRQQSRLRLFEIGQRFLPRGPHRIEEEKVLAASVTGTSEARQWGLSARSVDFFDAKADVEALLKLTGRADKLRCDAVRHPALHPGQSARITLAGQVVGLIGVLRPEIQKQIGLKRPVVLFELAVSAVGAAEIPRFREISKYPAIHRDLDIVINEAESAQAVRDCIANVAGRLLVELELFDQYRGEGIDYGRKSLTLGLTLQDSSRTLKEGEVEHLMAEVVSALRQKLGAQLRK